MARHEISLNTLKHFFCIFLYLKVKFLLLFGDRAQITDVRMENDPLEYVELVGDSRHKYKIDSHFPDSGV